VNDFWYKATIFGLLLMFVCAPFAGFAPLLLIILLGGVYWFFAPIFQAFFNKPDVAGDCEASAARSAQSEGRTAPKELRHRSSSITVESQSEYTQK